MTWHTDRTDWCLHPPTACDSLGVNIIEIFLSLVGGGGTLPTAPLLPVNSPQVLQSVILGQDEDYCVVSIPEMSTVRPDLTPSLVPRLTCRRGGRVWREACPPPPGPQSCK